MHRLPRIAVTAGEPAGVGPELCVRLAQQDYPARLVFIGDKELLRATADRLELPFPAETYDGGSMARLQLLNVPARAQTVPGQLNTANAAYVLETLERAADGCFRGQFQAMVTNPVHKGVINDAGLPFTGHTEFLAQKTNTRKVVMLLAAGDLRVALATTHLPLSRVPESISRDMLDQTVRILHRELRVRFGIDQPRLLVCGLNPHAGEGGHLGREDMDVIEPAMHALREQGFDITGPVPADTAFTPTMLARHDVVLAMYHDQGLPVLKHVGFGNAVNVTLGLPIIRTSVDHGTALDIAGSGSADPGSLHAATRLALELVASQSPAAMALD
ncbi:MAG: 4-hydroxythreonine-4-phosphate dehydrogenase PdxA [Xanthomonadales bacterium]|nr:4-hydroxythreonine-4-phosphate dehydrogenase PdxA [Xanthomonadales bacterium]